MPSPGSRFLRACSATGLFFLKVTGRGENPPPEFHSLALEWPIKWVKKFYSILILWLHCGFKGSTPGHANSKITMR